MKKTFKKVLKTKTATPEELGEVLKYLNLPENRQKYYLSSTTKSDRIGKYHTLIIDKDNPEDRETYKIYEKKSDKDIVPYRLRYYDILRDECSDSKKTMQLWTLQKNIEYIFSKELKIDHEKNESSELKNLLEKVKKAKSYYGMKMLLGEKSSKKKKKVSKPNDRRE